MYLINTLDSNMMKGHSINKRLTIRIILFSSLVTICITALQLYNDYEIYTENINASQNYILTSYQKPLETSLWLLDVELIQSQIKGIYSIPDITYVGIHANDKKSWKLGLRLDKHTIEQTLNLTRSYIGGKELNLGQLVIQSDLTVVYQKLIDKTLLILLSNALKTFFVAGYIIFMVNRLVTKPLNEVIEYFKKYQIGQANSCLQLRRSNSYGDEIDILNLAVNNMSEELSDSYMVLLDSKKQLTSALSEKQALLEQEIYFKENLELMVQERTKELEETLQVLKNTQESLIEQEKMASLGGLVNGVAHEINTPLGISITASTFVEDKLTALQSSFESGQLSSTLLSKFISEMNRSLGIVHTNLQRTAVLVSSFKEVAVDQSNQAYVRFQFNDHLKKLIVSMSHELKIKGVEVKTVCEDCLWIESYPGAYIQVFTNLINNSIRHGFDDWHGSCLINITVKQIEEELIIVYQDSGKGVSKSIKDKIFEPFVTTKRGQGGSGLGTNIMYNLVTVLLQGRIICESEPNNGSTFIITVPFHCKRPVTISK